MKGIVLNMQSVDQKARDSCSENETLAARKLLVLNASLPLEAIRERKLEGIVTNTDLEGFFEHVWTVHPFATLVTSNDGISKYGSPEVHAFAQGHTFIEGKVGRFRFLKWVEPLNFLISQIDIFFRLARLIRKERISVIDAWTPLYPGLFAWALSRLCGIPFVVRVVQNNDKIYEVTGRQSERKLWFTRKNEKFIERFVLKRANLVAAVNQDNLNFALANGAVPEKSTLFRYGNQIDQRHFSKLSERPDGSFLLREIGVEPHRFVIYVGRFESVKHPGDVLRVFAKIRSFGHDVKLIMAGDGSLREKLYAQARELGIENDTLFCGNKDQTWLISVIPLAALVLSPHTGRALLEVAMAEVPIVAYDVDWQSELIETGVTGELVPLQAWEEMADRANYFLTNPEYASAMGKSVSKRAAKMMDPAKLNQHERATYIELLSNYSQSSLSKDPPRKHLSTSSSPSVFKLKSQLSDNVHKLFETKLAAERRLLVLDTAWTLEAIRERKLEDSITCRDLDGFFEHVWSIHPFASLVTSKEWTSKYGQPEFHELSASHTFVEGKMGRFRMLRGFPPLNFLISQMGIFADLVSIIQEYKISAIRVGDPHYLGLFGWGLSCLCGIPFGIRVSANYDKIFETTGQLAVRRLFFFRKVEKIVERFILKRACFVAAGNQDNLNFSLANGARPEVSTLFRYGNLIDKRHFVDPKDRAEGTSLLEELDVEQCKFLLYIGRLEEIKQPSHILYVLSDIRKRGNDIKVLLVGDGSLREQLQRLAQELEVENQVIFCGNRDQEWLARVIPLALMVVSPHTGRALSEAALGAVPIVAYDVDWQSELIQTGKTGELVPNLDWKKMADAVESLLADPKNARSMGDAVRNRALKMMNPAMLDQHERETYLRLFDSLHKQQIDRNIEVHDKTASNYVSVHGEIFNDTEQERLSLVLKKSLQAVKTGSKNLTALDYGCGSGNVTEKLLNLNVNVVAADVSGQFLKLVRQNFSSERLSTLSLNGRDLLGVKAERFDFIAIYSVLHHIPDYLSAITELARVCKPGGIIYIDHESNDEYYFGRPVYKEFKSKALLTDWKKYFVFGNYVGGVRRLFNSRHSNEGDIHVWSDDRIEFQRIEKNLKEQGFEVILSKDYLHSDRLYRPEIYKEYEELCSDTRLMVFRKGLA
jgi:glycosyltransferase involved in cell wall biosynthesis/ubiquinone/menaquinone biosynthesis C-methylase UbiE